MCNDLHCRATIRAVSVPSASLPAHDVNTLSFMPEGDGSREIESCAKLRKPPSQKKSKRGFPFVISHFCERREARRERKEKNGKEVLKCAFKLRRAGGSHAVVKGREAVDVVTLP